MEKLTTLNLTFDRIIIQLVTPGLIAAYPYILLFFHEREDSKEFFLSNKDGIFIAFLIVIGLIVGLLLENIGSRIELHYYDRKQKEKDSGFVDTWQKFLQLPIKGDGENEPVGHGYIRNILFRMKFELSVGVALLFMVVGLGIYNADNTIFKSCYLNLLLVYVLPIALSLYLILFEGYASAKILGETRKLLVIKYYK
ncbi:hypothetical protein [Chryseolinea lacunae]|uniref:RDD domain-containing protein n=1 Tax=Chryseolinea lacunae TaxID=2801331 RepID=A0ABS1KM41_9BACT|nr:hypothetical protein [Chryseolinea lacunae]MBL0740538.1 hypothetical protein [Chryseolinea lacunae]